MPSTLAVGHAKLGTGTKTLCFTSFANSGVGYMFDLQFMDFSFEKKTISSLESVTNLPITANRCARGCKYSKLNDTSHIETVIGDGADSGLYPMRIGGRPTARVALGVHPRASGGETPNMMGRQ